MSFKIAEVVLSSAVASGGTFTVNYPDGTNAGDYAPFGHIAYARGLMAEFSQDDGGISVSLGTSNATVTYNGATSIPANSLVTVQLNMRGQDNAAPINLFGVERAVLAPLVRIDIGTPVLADADAVIKTQSISATTGPATGFDGVAATPYGGAYAVFDVPRNVVAAWTTSAVMTVTGEDEYGNVMVESSGSGTSMTGKKAFKKVTDVAVSANVTSATVGFGDVFGLPCFLPATTCVLATLEDGVPTYGFQYDGDTTGAPVNVTNGLTDTVVAGVQTTPTATTGDVRGTVDPATAADGSTAFGLLVWLTDPTYKGVDQYAG